jgi:alkanesulfonate monooxygenase SsuD/methylene tetrahydromethanopterin reductase-like flavin-dependent oxidoreductase (luciferase family)
VLSGGRFELGIGAGWAKEEYVLAGQSFDPPRVRADRFEEALSVIRRLLSGEEVSHRGEHYRLGGLSGSPLPVQSPIPLLIGGGGPRMIRLAGAVADIAGFVPRSLPEGGLDPAGFAPSAMGRRVDWLDEGISASGRIDGGPERSVLLFGVNESVAEVEDLAALSHDEIASSPHALLGSIATMIDALHERRERWGLTYHVCFDRDLDRLAPVVAALAG